MRKLRHTLGWLVMMFHSGVSHAQDPAAMRERGKSWKRALQSTQYRRWKRRCAWVPPVEH